MSNTPLRAAFWALLLSCGLLTAAAVSDPHQTHLVLTTPDEMPAVTPPTIEPSLNPLVPDVMLADEAAAPPEPPAASEWLTPEPADPADLFLAETTPERVPRPAATPRREAEFGPTIAPVPTIARRSESTSESVAEPIRIAATGELPRIGLDAAERPAPPTAIAERAMGRDNPFFVEEPAPVQRPVPSPLDAETAFLPTLPSEPQFAAAEPTAAPAKRVDPPSLPSPVAVSRPAPSASRRGAEAPFTEADFFPDDVIASSPAPASDPLLGSNTAFGSDTASRPRPVQVAQLDLLNQLKDLQKATQKRNTALDAAQSGGAIGEDGELSGEPKSEPVPEPILEFESSGRSLAGEETFRLQISNAPIAQVLEMIGDLGEINILSSGDVVGTVSNNLYDVTVDEALEAICHNYELEHERIGKFVHVTTVAAAEQRRAAAQKTIAKIYRPGFIAVRDLEALITPLLTPNIGVISVSTPAESGIEPDNSSAGGDSLSQPGAIVVLDYADRIAEIDRLVESMDVAPPQVAIDAVIMQVRLNDRLNLGVNLALAGSGNNDLLVSGSGAAIGSSAGFPLPSVTGTGAGANEIIEPLGRLAASSAGLSFGYLRGDFSALFEALEEITDVSLVASPHVQVVNKQKAEIIIGERLGYKTLSFNNTQTIEDIQFLDSGTRLLLRPFVAPNGLIRLEVHPERSSAQIDSLTGLPQQQTTEVTTNVMVRDGDTLVIGGLIEEQIVQQEQQVPLLGSIPLLGRAFQNSSENLLRTELIVLLTPRIVRDHDASRSAAVAHEFAKRADNFHSSLSPIARDQLAAMHRRRAEEALAAGDILGAREHVQKALLIDPGDMKALRLRDLILGY